ncbi:glycosyltransferase [uncultured Cohaesibacter sp.]|uniref:glycosyltransferase n=1 Tax=uncultured Cohaesibacter sp. TaxID=1002546 RepID=UPI002AAB8767|nr:glycosyltransferase [uncultured Cohaesibacter sp.]
MNAWYFTFEYPPEFGGGLSTYMRIVTEGYADRPNDELIVFCLSTSQSGLMTRRYLHKNVQLITLNPLRFAETKDIGYWVGVSRMFERFADLIMMQINTGAIDSQKPDYVEFCDGFGIGALTIQQKLALNSSLADVPILVTAHTPTRLIDMWNLLPNFILPNYWSGQMEFQALAGADIVIGCSQAILEVIQRELAVTGAQLAPHHVVHNPYPVSNIPMPDADMPRDHFYMASRLTHWKGAENAIKAFKVLWDSGCDVSFHIFGDDTIHGATGDDYSKYLKKRYAKYFDLGLIKLMGKQPREVIAESARTAYAQVHPSLFDNFPYSLLEAMSDGIVCVAGQNGGIKEIAEHGREILLTDVQNPNEFAEVLKQAMELSAEERADMSGNARAKIVEACDVGEFFAKKEQIVREWKSRDETEARSYPFLSPPETDCVFKAEAREHGQPELSVVIPYFNMGAFIDETLVSVKNSTVKDIEIVLVNDGSTDPLSVSKLETLNQDHGLDESQLRIVTIPNGGVANARNTGVREAKGRYVSLLDADDLIRSCYYEKALRVLETYDNVSFCGAWIEDYNTHGRIRHWATWNAEPPIQLIMNQTNCQSLVYKRAAFERDGWHDPDLRMFLDDWAGVISLLAGGHRGIMIPEPLFQYRIRPNSIFRSTGGIWDINYEMITRKHRELYGRWGAEIAAFLNVNGPNNFYHVAGKESAFRK